MKTMIAMLETMGLVVIVFALNKSGKQSPLRMVLDVDSHYFKTVGNL